jgi:hypothetical protein
MSQQIQLSTPLQKLFSLLLVFSFVSVSKIIAQHTYTVIGNKGDVMSNSLGRPFQPGDIISVEEQVTFKGIEDLVGLIRDDGRRFVLKNIEGKKNFSANMKTCLVIGQTRVEWKNFLLTTRDDLRFYFSERPYIFLDSVSKIRINPKTHPQTGSQFFYFTFKWKGPKGWETIDKKLHYKKDTLILYKSSIFSVDKKPIKQEDVKDYTLMYFNKGELNKVGPFNVEFPDEERMKAEVKIIVDIQRKNNFSDKTIAAEVEGFINQFYGNTDKINIQNWLAKHFDIRVPETSKQK